MKHRYDRDTCLLCAPASVQNYILDRYRLTDGFKSEYIDHMLHTPENENVVMQIGRASCRERVYPVV